MQAFRYQRGVLHVEDVALSDIAASAGTPTYVYSTAAMLHQVDLFRQAFGNMTFRLFFAVKANGNLAVLRTLHQAGAGADVVSQGELRKALLAGIPAQNIIYSGVGKTDDDLAFALKAGIYQINIETEGELERLSALSASAGKTTPIALRVNPAVGAGGHAKITTGLESSKFGVSLGEAEELYKKACALPGLEPVGLAVHIGSQIHELSPLHEAFIRLRRLAEGLRGQGLPVTRLDLGGGLGVFYDGTLLHQDDSTRIKAYAQIVHDVMDGFDGELSFEPGRLIMANAGLLLTKVITLNTRPQKTFLVVDAGMNDLMRPTLYDARHDIWPVKEGQGEKCHYDVVGPVCESSDSFGEDFLLPQQRPGDLVGLLSAGAYGAAMSSTYNQRPLAAEVLVNKDRWSLIRPRQSYEDLLGGDALPDWLV